MDIVPSDGLMNVELLRLLELKELRKLGILVFSDHGSQITFEGGVRPLLEGSGSSLTCLKLEIS